MRNQLPTIFNETKNFIRWYDRSVDRKISHILKSSWGHVFCHLNYIVAVCQLAFFLNCTWEVYICQVLQTITDQIKHGTADSDMNELK